MKWGHRTPLGRDLPSWTVLTAALGVLLGCTTITDGSAVAAGEHSAQPVKWGQCQIVGGGDGGQLPPTAQCGNLAVPIDYAKPDGPFAHLALIRFPATGRKIGSLVINPGGPGGSGVDAAVGLLNALPPQIRQRFDLIGFDPRGIGSSTPELRCNSDADQDALRADPQVDYSPAGVAHIEADEKQFVQRCVATMGTDFLANIGTAEAVKDLEALRITLGDEKLTYLGYSYGTFIGSAYAEAYPDNVRAMVLDGAVDPNVDSVQDAVHQAAGFQKAFDNYAADCAKNSDCPLGTEPAKAVDVYHHLVDPLVDKPAATTDPRGLGYSDAIMGTEMALYSPSLWQQLTDGLTELSTGSGDTLLSMADSYFQRDDHGHYGNANDAQIAITCVDQPANANRAKAIDEDLRLRQAAPFASYGHPTGDAPLNTCAFWPVAPTSTTHAAAAPGLPSVLVVSTTNDPATPYQDGVALAKQLDASLLTYNGTQHTVVFQGDRCVDGYAASYLTDLTQPPPDAKC